MATEAQNMRKLMESMPDQRSTYDQLLDMLELATQAGLYDAADWLKEHLRQMQASFTSRS